MDLSESSRHRTTAPPALHDPDGVRVIGLIGWAVIFGAFLVWEGLGLTVGHQWPTLSHMLRAVTRPLPGRLVLFGLWLWVGWHLFIRGWDFFLRGPLPEAPSPGGSGGLSLGQMWQQAIVPLTGFYALFLGMLAFSARRQLPDDHDTASEAASGSRSEEHTSELQSPCNLVCRLLLEKKNTDSVAVSTSNKRRSAATSSYISIAN